MPLVQRSTYVLDKQTARALSSLIAAWKVSKGEAIRRAVQQAFERLERGAAMGPDEALRQLASATAVTSERVQEANNMVREVAKLRSAAADRLEMTPLSSRSGDLQGGKQDAVSEQVEYKKIR